MEKTHSSAERTEHRADAALGLMASRSGKPVAQGHSEPGQAPSGSNRILPLTSSSEVYVPPRGRSFLKFSFDFPEPSVEFEGLKFGFRLCTFENVYGLDASRMTVEGTDNGLKIDCSRLVWAGGQQQAPGKLMARLRKNGAFVEWDVHAEMEQPIKSVTSVVRGVPRGNISVAGGEFFDPRNDEVLLGYPFADGDFFMARVMRTPIAVVRHGARNFFVLSALNTQVRANRIYFQPGESSYRVEMVFEREGWEKSNTLESPTWRVGETASAESAFRPHYEHLERVFRLPDWATRKDMPDWSRKLSLVVGLPGAHWTGYILNDYAKMQKTLEWIATLFPAERVLVFLMGWDGRFYWTYPLFAPDERLGGVPGFRALIGKAQSLGFHMMPMFGTNGANVHIPVFSQVSDATTSQIDGDPYYVFWVDWDSDRHREGWMPYMNVGVDSWRNYLQDRILDVIEQFHVDSYYLDIVGGWVNNPRADMHEGTRRLVEKIREKHPEVLACGEQHYDALFAFIPLVIYSATQAYPLGVGKYGRTWQGWPMPGRGSAGVNEAGFRARPSHFSLAPNPYAIPAISFVDDTLDRYRTQVAKVLQAIKEREGIR